MRISVVMATFNGEAHVREQLMSILENGQRPTELVIVDDGSTDQTVAIVKEVIAAHPDVDVILDINPRNSGATASFIKGILRSTGDMILCADQDDKWMPDKIGKLVKCFRDAPDLLLAYSDGLITDEQLVPSGHTIFSTRSKAQLALGSARPPMEVAANPDIKGCTMAVRGTFVRELLSNTDPELGRYWGHDHWIALFAHGLGAVRALEEPLLLHRFHSSNTSAGTRFSPWSPSHWQKWLRLARSQQRDHLTTRYRLAMERAKAYEARFSAPLIAALGTMMSIASKREQLKQRSFLGRVRCAFAIHKAGIYKKHYNGVPTMLRDIFL